MKKLKVLFLFLCMFLPIIFVGCENKNKNTLSTPSIISISGGNIVFNSIKNAEYYTILINDFSLNVDAKYSNNVEIIDNCIHFDASNIFEIGESYSVRVKANAKEKNSSSFSAAYSYRHGGSVKKPCNVKINSSILTWDVVENASFYLVKVITPYNNILLDKEGNVLPEDDLESIAKADLTEYSFNTNQFDFGSLLGKAGVYKFYICAVLSDGTSYVESGYTTKITYTHFVTLETPINGQIERDNNEDLHLVTAIDPNANAISITCNGYEKTAELNESELSIVKIENNYLDINLSKYFQDLILTGKINFNALQQFTIKTQAKHISNAQEVNYYINSNYSTIATFENTSVLTAPNLTLTYNNLNNCFIANWTDSNTTTSSYRLYVFTPNEMKQYNLDKNTYSQLIYEDFVAVAIKAIGSGNTLSSSLSDLVSNPELGNELSSFNHNLNSNTITWDEIADAYYVVEFGQTLTSTNLNSYEIPTSLIESNDITIKINVIKAEFKHTTKTINLEYLPKLATPSFGYGQGFSGTKLYHLTFNEVAHAMGYYIYIKGNNSEDFYKIPTLYTTTTIDLTQYICQEGEYTDYEVKVQAVADPYSVYGDSALSSSLTVSHVKILETPNFYKVGDSIIPVVKQVEGNQTKYFLKFYGVQSAGSYEILINYNKLKVNTKSINYTGEYSIDISRYLIAANNYEIKVRALPIEAEQNVQASPYATTNYALLKQLSPVENIKVTENEGVYTLSFDPIDNAERYRVRIVKENDRSYVDYLNTLQLSNSFEITESVDVSQYLKQQGTYYFYITALAPKQNSHYADANESTQYGYVSKMTTLEKPYDITFVNESNSSYMLSWQGDANADYYLIKLVTPHNLSYELKAYNTTSVNINSYMTVQGTYNVSIYSMVNATGENAKEFSSSSASDKSEVYNYTELKDFERYSIFMYGENYDFVVSNIDDLKNILWYHYLYEIDNNGLSIMLKRDNLMLRDIIYKLSEEANNSDLYLFFSDQEWLNLQRTGTSNEMFAYLCQKILELYPESNILQWEGLDHTNNSQIFNLKFKNLLNAEKVPHISTAKTLSADHGVKFTYIDKHSRKSATGLFAIDSREEMLVTTTEQLLQAVQHNRKPKFIGDSEVAEKVYANAKLVLSAIVSNNMTEIDKVTAIFDWLSSQFNLTYYKETDGPTLISGSLEKENLATYGLQKQYYLEGIFEGISQKTNGNLEVASNFATSASYSKAFALLCAIEGIEAIVVNGTYTYWDITSRAMKTVDHSWNKVYLKPSHASDERSWFVVDLTFADNRIVFNNLSDGYGLGSHTTFLVSDNSHLGMLQNIALPNNNDESKDLQLKDLNHIISSDYQNSRVCETSYDYHYNVNFGLTHDEIKSTIKNFENPSLPASDFIYSYEFDSTITYQKYLNQNAYGELKAFLFNGLVYSKYKMSATSANSIVFEFKFKWQDNGNVNAFSSTPLLEIFNTASNYGLNLELDNPDNIYSVQDGETRTTTVMCVVKKSA